MSFNKRIKQRREELGLTQAGLARLLQVTTQAVQHWESAGKDSTTPKRGKRAKLAEILKTTEGWLEFGEGKPEAKHAAREANADYELPSTEGIEVALAWDKLSEHRKEIFRELIFFDALLTNALPPWFKIGRPKSASYSDFERSVVKDMQENKHQLKLKF